MTLQIDVNDRLSPASAGLTVYIAIFLGFRCASPQALRSRPLRGLTRKLIRIVSEHSINTQVV